MRKHHSVSLKRRIVAVGLLAAIAMPVGGAAFAGGKPTDNFFSCKQGDRMGNAFSGSACNFWKYRGHTS